MNHDPAPLPKFLEDLQKAAAEPVNREYMRIHQAIHNPMITMVEVGACRYPVTKAPNGLRQVKMENVTFREQNKNKLSKYAERARAGERITWGIKSGNWILITDNGVQL